jgi:hypothetical protein
VRIEDLQNRVLGDTGLLPADPLGNALAAVLLQLEHAARRLTTGIADLRDHLDEAERRLAEGSLGGIGVQNISASAVAAAVSEVHALDEAYRMTAEAARVTAETR